jgi:3-hydroxyisobutyrate dehydrogenase-like beta-hydroxyacid dehydrogenase
MEVEFLGTGRMGKVMAANLLKAGRHNGRGFLRRRRQSPRAPA